VPQACYNCYLQQQLLLHVGCNSHHSSLALCMHRELVELEHISILTSSW
jgi:hypothetical protein